jgi:hypothetical protein
MTAPDHFAKTNLNPFAGGGRPHMIVMVRQPGRGVDGWTEQEFANEMINHKAAKAINLDNSGSSQFLYTKDGQSFTESKMGDKLPTNIGDQPVNTLVSREYASLSTRTKFPWHYRQS